MENILQNQLGPNVHYKKVVREKHIQTLGK